MATIGDEQRQKQLGDILEKYPSLSVDQEIKGGTAIVYGLFALDAAGPSGSVQNNFELEIQLPADYPEILPTTKEVRGNIDKEFEHIYPDGSFCLAAPMEERMLFNKAPTLLGYVEHLLIPFLYGYTVWEETRKMPFDELDHGFSGILDWYQDQLSPTDLRFMIRQLWLICLEGYRGETLCACGSGKAVRKCHHRFLGKLAKSSYRKQLQTDIYPFAKFMGLAK